MFDIITKKFGSSYYPSLKESWDVDNLWESFTIDFSDMFFGDECYINKDGETIYEIEVPGFNKDNLHVDMFDGILTVKGTRNINVGEKKLHKKINIGFPIDVSAEVKDGILTLTIKTEKKDIRKLEIK